MTRPALPVGSSDPFSFLGLFFLGFTCILFNLHTLHLFHLHAAVLSAGIFYGSLGQIGVGLAEWRRKRPFAAVTFTALGLFWLSLIALVVLPSEGAGQSPEGTAMAAYLAMWAFFTLFLFAGSFQTSSDAQLPLGLLLFFLILQATGVAMSDPLVQQLASWIGLLGGLIACGMALIRVASATFWRSAVTLEVEAQKRA
jgi:succinate-acetate transporter protein